MGFDLCDSADENSWLSVSFWQWRPIVAAIRQLAILADDRVDQLTAQYCGYGLSADEAHQVGSAIKERLIPTLRPGEWIAYDGSRTTEPPNADASDDEWESAYGVDRRGLERFIEFCERCNGFEVN